MLEVNHFLAFIQVTVLLYPLHVVNTIGINKIDNSCTVPAAHTTEECANPNMLKPKPG